MRKSYDEQRYEAIGWMETLCDNLLELAESEWYGGCADHELFVELEAEMATTRYEKDSMMRTLWAKFQECMVLCGRFLTDDGRKTVCELRTKCRKLQYEYCRRNGFEFE